MRVVVDTFTETFPALLGVKLQGFGDTVQLARIYATLDGPKKRAGRLCPALQRYEWLRGPATIRIC